MNRTALLAAPLAAIFLVACGSASEANSEPTQAPAIREATATATSAAVTPTTQATPTVPVASPSPTSEPSPTATAEPTKSSGSAQTPVAQPATPTPAAPTPMPPTPTPPPASGAPMSATVGIADVANRFTPASVTVAAGGTVSWSWNGNGFHDVTGSFGSSGNPVRAGSYSATFPTPGTYTYACQVHESLGMRGTVVVQ